MNLYLVEYRGAHGAPNITYVVCASISDAEEIFRDSNSVYSDINAIKLIANKVLIK